MVAHTYWKYWFHLLKLQMTNKSIDINQRIPLETLYVALENYLNDTFSDDYILEQLKLHFSGENRLKKSLRIVKKIVSNNPIIELVNSNKTEVLSALKTKTDKNVILIALLNSSFIFSYDVLSILGKLFKVQEIVNREALTRELSKMYGSNRALPNAIDSVIPMFLEAGLFLRPKPAIYKWNGSLQISLVITNEIFIESFRINNSIIKILDYQFDAPYFLFVD